MRVGVSNGDFDQAGHAGLLDRNFVRQIFIGVINSPAGAAILLGQFLVQSQVDNDIGENAVGLDDFELGGQEVRVETLVECFG